MRSATSRLVRTELKLARREPMTLLAGPSDAE